jgi:phosphoribosylformylglycinamidine cyclo-ligase
MCVNDIVAQGAEPLYFLDYIATGKNVPERLEKVVAGVADGCIQAGAALIGGETAEMPGMYDENDYDLAGFAVGIAEKSQLVTGEKIQAGDVLIGLPSSGVHSNGFSLVRKIFFEQHQLTYDAQLPELSQTLGKELLTPTRIYVQAILPLVKEELVHGIAHVTGGGFVENLPRMLPDGLAIKIQENSWPILPIFDVLSSYGNLPTHEMYEIFNMGIGMVVAVAPENVTKVQTLLKKHDEASYIIGKVIDQGEQPIVFNEVEA